MNDKQFARSMGYTGKEAERITIKDYCGGVYCEEFEKEGYLKDEVNIKKGDSFMIISYKVSKLNKDGGKK